MPHPAPQNKTTTMNRHGTVTIRQEYELPADNLLAQGLDLAKGLFNR